ncbi:unnamed protein product [Camellia sinensis]
MLKKERSIGKYTYSFPGYSSYLPPPFSHSRGRPRTSLVRSLASWSLRRELWFRFLKKIRCLVWAETWVSELIHLYLVFIRALLFVGEFEGC